MSIKIVWLIIGLTLVTTPTQADDGRGLRRGANGQELSLSGISSGAAMAVQYAVAHSASVLGVGSIAGPAWGCAEGRVAQAINDCMCGRDPVSPRVALARRMATRGEIDALPSGKPQALKQAYVFHSAQDQTVTRIAGQSSIDFLAAFVGQAPVADWGRPDDGSDRAGHGIISPEGGDSCTTDGKETSFVRRCGGADNAGHLFHSLFGQGSAFDPGRRSNHIPPAELWSFDQQRLIDEVKQLGATLASDKLWFGFFPYKSARRNNLDLAATGYLYVPPSCRPADSHCRVHIALHGCKQDAKAFAHTAGYNNWAEHYRVIVVYPAIAPDSAPPLADEVCRMDPIPDLANSAWVEPNPNGCWDWWGYLDTGLPENRYLSHKAPQMQFIERLVAELVKPAR